MKWYILTYNPVYSNNLYTLMIVAAIEPLIAAISTVRNLIKMCDTWSCLYSRYAFPIREEYIDSTNAQPGCRMQKHQES